jgi:rubrerythrin
MSGEFKDEECDEEVFEKKDEFDLEEDEFELIPLEALDEEDESDMYLCPDCGHYYDLSKSQHCPNCDALD